MRPIQWLSRLTSDNARRSNPSRTVLRIENLEAREVPADISFALGVLTFTAGTGINNNTSVTISGSNFVFNDTAETITSSATGASGSGTNTVTIPTTNVTGITLNLGTGADVIPAAGVVIPGVPLILGNTGTSLTVSGPITTNAGSMSITATNTITLGADLNTTTGNLSISSANAVALGANVTTTTGTISIAANTDGAGTQGISQTAGLITTTNTTATAATITANTAGGGTGSITVDNFSVGAAAGGKLTINSNGGSIVYAGTTALTTSQQGLASGGSAPSTARILKAHDFAMSSLATGTGGVGTSARPIQTALFASGTASLTAGSGGAYMVQWPTAGSITMTLSGASATGASDVRVVSGNATGSNLTISGNVTAATGNIYLAADDNLVDNAATIGGAGFSGTVWMQANRDASTAGQPITMSATSSIVTSNKTNVVTGTRTPTTQAVYMDISGDATGPSLVTLGNITTGDGGRIVVNSIPNGIVAEAGKISMAGTSNVLNAGPTGTVDLKAGISIATLADTIGASATPIKVAGGNVIINNNFGNTYVSGTASTTYTATVTNLIAGQTAAPITNLASAGTLTVVGPITSVNSGAVSLTGTGGVVINAALGDANTGNLTINAGSNPATLNTSLTLSPTQALSVTAANGLEVSSTGVLTGTDATTSAGAVTVNSGGQITPAGTAAIGTLSTGNLKIASGGKLQMELNSSSSYDALNVNGTVDLTGSTLIANVTGSLSVGDALTLVNNDGADPVVGQFATGTIYSAANNARYQFTINYAGGDGNDVVATVSNIVQTSLLDVTADGMATLFSADGLNNNLSMTQDGVNYTITDTAGVITLSQGAISAGWTGDGTQTVTGPIAGLTGLTVNVATGSDTLNNFDAGALPLSILAFGTLDIAGLVKTTGALTVSGPSNITDTTGLGLLGSAALNLSASNGLGTPAQPLKTQAATITASAGTGGVSVAEADGAHLSVTTTGDLNATNTAGPLTIDSVSAANINVTSTGGDLIVPNAIGMTTGNVSLATVTSGVLNLGGTITTTTGNISLASADAVTLATNITTTGGNISIAGSNAVTLGANISSGAGTINIAANTDGAGTDSLSQTGGTITSTNTTTSAVTVTVNTAVGGTGDAVLDSTSVGVAATGGTLNVNSNGGNILYAGATALTTSQQGIVNGGSAPTRVITARDYRFTATGAGSIGTDARPMQVSNIGTDSGVTGVASNSLFSLNGGDGGVYLTKWNTIDLTLTGASATGTGNIRIVSANASGDNLYVTGNVGAVSGNIYLASDDDVGIQGTSMIGGPGFSGTVYIQGNRDRGNPQPLKMDSGTSIITSNTTNTSVPLTQFRTPTTQAVYLDISGDAGTPSVITLGNVSAGNGGRIVVNSSPNAYLATSPETEAGQILMAGSANVLDAGATGTIELIGRNTAATAADVIGTAASPVKVAGGNVIANTNLGNTYVTGLSATNVTSTTQINTDGATGQTGATTTTLATTAGVLTINGATNNVNGGPITLTGADGVVLAAQLGNSTAGAIAINGPLSGSGNIVLGTGGLTVTQNTDSTYDGVISGPRSATKAGTGNLTLTANNLHTLGTIVSAGTLTVGNTTGSATGTGPVTVADGALLSGTGFSTGALTDSGTVSPAGNAIGVLTTGSLSFGAAGTRTLAINLNGMNAGTDYDQLQVNGTVDLTGATLAVTTQTNFNPPVGTVLTILTNDGGDTVTPFTGLPQGGVITVGARKYGISYIGGDGNDVTLTAISGPPVNTVPGDQATNEDTDLVFSAATSNAVSVANDPEQSGNLRVTLTATQGDLSLPATSGLSFTVGDGTHDTTMTFTGSVADINTALDGLRFSSSQNPTGTATITIATDDQGAGGPTIQTDTDVVSVTVTAVNDAPVNILPPAFAATEDTPVVLAGISVTDVDSGSGNVQVTLSVPAGILNVKTDVTGGIASGDVTGNGTNSIVITGTTAAINATLADANGLTFTPALNANGSVSLTMLTNDLGNTGSGTALTDFDTSSIAVAPVDDAPTINDVTLGYNSLMVNGATVGTVPTVEVDGDSLTYAIVSGNDNGAFAIDNNGKVTVANATALTGATFALTITATDNTVSQLSDSATVTIVPNEVPTVTGGGLPDVNKTENDPAFDIDLSPYFNDAETPDADLVFTVTGNIPSGIVTTSIAGTTLTVTPLAHQNGTVSITVRAADNIGQFVEETFNVMIAAVNDPPTNNVPGSQTIDEDTPLTLSGTNAISVTDIDAGSGNVTVTLTALNGTVSVGGPASITNNASALVIVSGTIADINTTLNGLVFTPTHDFNGAASIQVVTNDNGNTGSGISLPVMDTVNITVNPVNDAPTLDDITNPAAIDEDSGEQTVTLTGITTGPANESDQTIISITATSGNTPLISSVTVIGNDLKYTPVPNANGTAVITVRVEDDGGGTTNFVEKTFTVTVNPVNDPPTLDDITNPAAIDEDSGEQTV
ncbi:Ig-like domain-containing protein, partial [Zavarzinella formosa]|uniref:Ig-like domain-containing protein n=1 Tax=Zavarzinella formosa TaxID=360055 RepID=UPI00037257FF